MDASSRTSATRTPLTGLTAEEIAARFKVTAQSVRAWARAGRIPAYRAGTRFRFDLAEVEKALRLGSKGDGDE